MGKVRIINRSFAKHVDDCPMEKRDFHGKKYANVFDDCSGCSYLISYDGYNGWLDCALMDDDPEILEEIQCAPAIVLEDRYYLRSIGKYRLTEPKVLKICKLNNGAASLDWPRLRIHVFGDSIEEARSALEKEMDNLWRTYMESDTEPTDSYGKDMKQWLSKYVRKEERLCLKKQSKKGGWK